MLAAPSNRKTLSLDALLALRADARDQGRSVVHCHGCFDIVHPGHIQHLQYARSLGDMLIVSVSADTHVNKGVDRPLIPDDLRASSLAALECVDAVHVNPHPTAVELLETLRPDVYVKGREYERNVDPRFLAERDAVVRHGGRIIFSSGEVVYSSTALIGTLPRGERFQDEKIARLRDRHGLTNAHLESLVRRFRGQRVVVVGDYILDRYHFCDATGVAGEGPMLSLRSLQQKDFDGGAGGVALHLAAMGASPTLVCATADDELSRRAELRMAAEGVEVCGQRTRRDVVTKHRYLVEHNKLFKVDEGSPSPADPRMDAELATRILEAADGAHAVIFADHGYGVITAGLLDCLLPTLQTRVPKMAASGGGRQSNLLRFGGMDLLCAAERDVRAAQNDFVDGLGAVMWNVFQATHAHQAIVSLGSQGIVTFDRGEANAGQRLASEYLPPLGNQSIDALGIDDALLAVATLTLSVGGSLSAAAYLGSIASKTESQKIGNVSVSASDLLEHIEEAIPASSRATAA